MTPTLLQKSHQLLSLMHVKSALEPLVAMAYAAPPSHLLPSSNTPQGHSKVQAFTLQKVYKEHGLEAANTLAAFALAQQYHMKQVVDRENLDCEFEMRRSYDVYIDEEDAKQAEELYRTAMREGYPWARDLDLVGGEFVEQVCILLV
jgi:hypothetical protein